MLPPLIRLPKSSKDQNAAGYGYAEQLDHPIQVCGAGTLIPDLLRLRYTLLHSRQHDNYRFPSVN